jgi:hypothetical protein
MNVLLTDFLIDWPICDWGLAFGLFAAFGAAFMKKICDGGWVAVPSQLLPPTAHAAQNFDVHLHERRSYVWVPEADLSAREIGGFTYYQHQQCGARCFRLTESRGCVKKEFLMLRPGVGQIDASLTLDSGAGREMR